MFTTIIIGLLALIGLLLLAFGPKLDTGETRKVETGEVDRFGVPTYDRVPVKISTKLFGLLPLIIALLIAFFACTTQVQAKQVGVVTAFGKPASQTLPPGFHVKAPWESVTEIDATIQTDEYHGDSGIKVRLSDGNTATVSATIRWAVSAENANDVYADFRSDDPTKSLRDAVVSTQFKAATNSVFATFDPLSLAGATAKSPDYNALASEVEKVMLTKTNHLVEIESITISLLTLDEKSQKKIDEYIGEVAKTRIAKQAQATASAQAAANKILSDSISNDPNVLVAQCFDLIADGFNPPAGFSCWGTSGAVVVPSK